MIISENSRNDIGAKVDFSFGSKKRIDKDIKQFKQHLYREWAPFHFMNMKILLADGCICHKVDNFSRKLARLIPHPQSKRCNNWYQFSV